MNIYLIGCAVAFLGMVIGAKISDGEVTIIDLLNAFLGAFLSWITVGILLFGGVIILCLKYGDLFNKKLF